ncbi:hypothetical protein ACFQI7_17140 [Paenibacillus allorhizosphaerae]|uniref:Acetyl-CoA acetyltransferase n=1 Tax=Paenibacillus allorhizosphaerae TaxID=2849866 RepID=A0ABM8VEE3_9BACL|nr:hypothetical protein [Paenibacillus allorhizosphaerae]CAG7631079.1 hypothetical protein PAECIP111802_01707 [Paenibacillus allorhizosphaerae]
MLQNPYEGQMQNVYELEAGAADLLHKCREKIHAICAEHMHKPIRVQTLHGQTHDGILVHIDAYHIYLQMLPGHSRALLPYAYPGFNPYYSNVILPLALFDLLTIALLV